MSNYGIEVKMLNEVNMMDAHQKIFYYEKLKFQWTRFKPFDEVSIKRRLAMLEAIQKRLVFVIEARDKELEDMAKRNLIESRMTVISHRMLDTINKFKQEIHVCLEKIAGFAKIQEIEKIENFQLETMNLMESIPVVVDSYVAEVVEDALVNQDFRTYNEHRFINCVKNSSHCNDLRILMSLGGAVKNLDNKIVPNTIYSYDESRGLVPVNVVKDNVPYCVLLPDYDEVWMSLFDRTGKDIIVSNFRILGHINRGNGFFISFKLINVDYSGLPVFLLCSDGQERSRVSYMALDFVGHEVIDYGLLEFKKNYEFKFLSFIDITNELFKVSEKVFCRSMVEIMNDSTIIIPIEDVYYESEKKTDDLSVILSANLTVLANTDEPESYNCFFLYVVLLEKDTYRRVSKIIGYSGVDYLYFRYKLEFPLDPGKQFSIVIKNLASISRLAYSLSSQWVRY
jgi:hypothetical protein